MVLGRRAAVPLGTVAAIGTLVVAVLVLRSETQGESTARPPKPPDVQVAHPGRFAGQTAPGLVAAPSAGAALGRR